MKKRPWRLFYFRMGSALTCHVAFLVCGIVLYVSDISNYGEVIYNESREWGLGAITDVTAV